MIHKAYMPVNKGSRFSLRAGRQTGQPEVVQEVLAYLKRDIYHINRSASCPSRLCKFTKQGQICEGEKNVKYNKVSNTIYQRIMSKQVV